MIKFLSHRVGDKRMQRYVARFLKAGIMEEGKRMVSDEGVPQGGSISPILSNIYLHYALDLWYEKRFKPSCSGQTRLIRYADDFVVCFASKAEAERFHAELPGRLGKFGLEVEPSKTKILAFGPGADRLAKEAGRRKAETFDFLGFTHYCSRSRTGRWFRMNLETAVAGGEEPQTIASPWLARKPRHTLTVCLRFRTSLVNTSVRTLHPLSTAESRIICRAVGAGVWRKADQRAAPTFRSRISRARPRSRE